MTDKQDRVQTAPQNSPQEPSLIISGTDASEKEIPQVSRPRSLSDAERVVEHEKKRRLVRDARDVAQVPDSDFRKGAAVDAFTPNTVDQQERQLSNAHEANSSRTKNEAARIIEDREMVKWAAWGALLVSLVTSLLLGLYSSREFGPMFEYYDLDVTQKQIVKEVERLKSSSQLEKIQNAITQAQVQLFVRKNYRATELILEHAKEELKLLIDALPVEKSIEPRQILANIEHVLAEVRQGPASLDQQLDNISTELSKLKN